MPFHSYLSTQITSFTRESHYLSAASNAFLGKAISGLQFTMVITFVTGSIFLYKANGRLSIHFDINKNVGFSFSIGI